MVTELGKSSEDMNASASKCSWYNNHVNNRVLTLESGDLYFILTLTFNGLSNVSVFLSMDLFYVNLISDSPYEAIRTTSGVGINLGF